jgi:hypothetical protein
MNGMNECSAAGMLPPVSFQIPEMPDDDADVNGHIYETVDMHSSFCSPYGFSPIPSSGHSHQSGSSSPPAEVLCGSHENLNIPQSVDGKRQAVPFYSQNCNVRYWYEGESLCARYTPLI